MGNGGHATGELVGYERVSTDDQSVALQHDALVAAGCTRFFTDVASGAAKDRPELARLFQWVREGDTVVVWRLDRWGRSLPDLLAQMKALEERGAGFRSLTEALDTTTPSGRLVFHVFGAIAQFERELIVQRTRAGIAAARRRGNRLGPTPKLTPERLAWAQQLRAEGRTVTETASSLGIHRATLHRWLRDS